MHTLFFPIRDQRLWRILLETFLLKWAWLEHWIVSRLNGKDPTLWWEVKKDFSFLATVHDLYWITKFILFMYVDDKSCTMCVLSVCTDSSFLLIMKCTNFGPTEQRSTFCLFWVTFIYLFIFTLGHPNKNTFVKKWSACIKIYKKNSVIYLWQYYTVLKALMPMGLRKCLKQIIWIKHNGVKNPNWPEANHWPFSRVVKDLTNLGLATGNKSS